MTTHLKMTAPMAPEAEIVMEIIAEITMEAIPEITVAEMGMEVPEMEAVIMETAISTAATTIMQVIITMQITVAVVRIIPDMSIMQVWAETVR